jgi:transcriptional regulator with GAF, ATPase, and Fis domain
VLERQSWHNWLLMLATLILTTVGLSAAMSSVVAERIRIPWAWPGSEYVLLGGLSMVVALFGFHLTVQRRRLARLQIELIETRETAAWSATRHYNRLMALYGVGQAMALETSPQAVFDSITETCFNVFECDRVSLMLRDREREELEVRAAIGSEGTAAVIGSRQKVGRGIAGWVAEHKEPVILGEVVDAARFKGFEPSKLGLKAALVAPIVVRDELVGVISLSSQVEGNRYDQDDLRALQVFAWNAGLCIRHAEQAGWMRQTIWRLEGSLRQQKDRLGASPQDVLKSKEA